MLNRLLQERNLLPILTHENGRTVTLSSWQDRRCEMLTALQTYSYGITPTDAVTTVGELLEEEPYAVAGKVCLQKIRLTLDSSLGIFSFPFWLAIPRKVSKAPVFLHIAFSPDIPYKYLPLEEITDAGFAVVSVWYQDMVNDSHFGDFSDGLAAYFGTTQERHPQEWGKIGMWAYGASRILDYLLTRQDIDASHTSLIGHSRLGKTALWAAAQDTRFWCTIANNSGYGGAATSKHGTGERVRDFLRVGSWDWYCEQFKDYTDEKEDTKPYDQAFLLALIAPRYLCVGSAIEDHGADPQSEFLTSLWASQAWSVHDRSGLITPNRLPVVGDCWQDGCIGYHLRAGRHYLSREDWQVYIRFVQSKLTQEAAQTEQI